MKDLSKSSLTPARVFKLLDKTLTDMIDDWYRNICGYYHIENVNEVDEFEPELKIFHDELGHRIKFAKDDLQCTYGLKVVEEDKANTIEVSVNNKVKSIDYEEFLDRLRRHYDAAGDKAAGTNYAEIFVLSSDSHKAFSVKRSEGKADIVRIGFQVDAQKISHLLADPAQLKTGVENYCLAPLRRIYAELYRKSKK